MKNNNITNIRASKAIQFHEEYIEDLTLSYLNLKDKIHTYSLFDFKVNNKFVDIEDLYFRSVAKYESIDKNTKCELLEIKISNLIFKGVITIEGELDRLIVHERTVSILSSLGLEFEWF